MDTFFAPLLDVLGRGFVTNSLLIVLIYALGALARELVRPLNRLSDQLGAIYDKLDRIDQRLDSGVDTVQQQLNSVEDAIERSSPLS